MTFFLFFFNDTATTEIYTTHNTLSLHDALPISTGGTSLAPSDTPVRPGVPRSRSEEHTSELQSLCVISYAVFCLKKKKTANCYCRRTARCSCACLPYRASTPSASTLAPFFFNETAPTEIYTPHTPLSLHDALPI